MARRQPKKRARFYVEMTDGTEYEVTAGDPDTIATEDKFGIDGTTWVRAPRTEHVAYLAWHALQRKKVIDLTWEDFKERFESVDPDSGDDEEPETVDPKD